MASTEPQLPVINNSGSVNRDTMRESDVSLATIIDFFMKRNSTLSTTRVPLQRSQLGLPRHVAPSLSLPCRNIVLNFDDKVGALENREDCEKSTFSDGRASPVPSQYSLASSVRYQNRSKGRVKLHHSTDLHNDDDQQSVKSVKSVRSAKSTAREKCTRTVGGAYAQCPDQPLGAATTREGLEKLVVTGRNFRKISNEHFAGHATRGSKKEQRRLCTRLLEPTLTRSEMEQVQKFVSYRGHTLK